MWTVGGGFGFCADLIRRSGCCRFRPVPRPVAVRPVRPVVKRDVDAVRELTDASCCGAQVKTVGLAKTFRDMRTDGSHPIG